jgi:hypothetical protein
MPADVVLNFYTAYFDASDQLVRDYKKIKVSGVWL